MTVLCACTALLASILPLPFASGVHIVAPANPFELDGNAIDDGAAGDDWSTLFPTNNSLAVFNASWVAEPASNDTTYFSVSSKDINDIDTWSVTGNSAPPKDEIVNAFAAAYNSSTSGMLLYFGADRWSNNGDAAVGFWFLQGPFLIVNGSVVGNHANNDTLVVSHFTNGGAVATIYVYKWLLGVPENLTLIASGADCATTAAGDLACARVNGVEAPSSVPYQGSGPKDPADRYPRNSFFEGGINLTALYGGAPPCFSNFVAETRSSQETTATLKDIAFHSFNNCPVVPPQSAITVEKLPLETPVDLGQPIGFRMSVLNSGPDPAESLILWDDLPPVSGTWTLGSAGDESDCAITGDNLTCDFGTVPVEDGSGIGTRIIEVTAGTADIGDCGEQPNTVRITANGGLANDESSALVYVWCSDVGVVKTAAASAVDLGANVAFDIVLTSFGPDDALDVMLEDPLPGLSGAWSLGGDNASSCGLSGDLLTCSFGTVPVGATRSITLTSSTEGTDDCGLQSNTATAWARVDTDASNNVSTDSTYVRCSDVGTEKVDGGDVYIGTDASFTITVTSNGPDTATNVTLEDPLPDPPGGWTVSDASAGASCGTGTGTLLCAFGDIPSGESRFVTITAPTSDPQTDCGIIENTATAFADVDTDPSNDSSTASLTVLCSDVRVQKDASAPAVDVGGSATFTITVTSAGPDTAQDVTLADTLPAIAGGWTLGGADAGDCAIVSGELTCLFGDVPAGEERVVTLTTTTTLDDCGDVRNIATVSALVDISLSDNTDDATFHVTCADVGVQKTATDDIIDVGQTAEFSIVVTSNGPDDALSVALADTLPALAGGWTLAGPDAGDCSLTGLSLTCAFGTMAPGATRTITLSGATTLDDCGLLDNLATVSASLDTDPTNDSDGASIYVTCADVGVEKRATDDTIDVGQTAEFSIVVTSSGPDAAESVSLTDTLPALAGGWTLGGPDAGDCSLTDLSLSCAFGTLAAGATRTITLSGATALEDCGALDNTATVTARLDTDATNDTDDASIYVTCADVSVQKTAADGIIDVGGNATFSITLTSNGPDSAESVSLADTLPAITGGWTLWGPGAGDCSLTGLSLACAFGTLASGATRTIHLSGSPGLDDCGLLENTATVGARLDTNASNDEDSASIHVTCADVGVQKTATDTSIDVGGTAEFGIVVTSFGPDSAESVSLADTLPALAGGWTLGGPDAGDCSLTGLSLSCAFGTIAPGDSRSVTVSGTAALDDCGALDNTATVTARLDTDATNDADGASIYVTCADVDVDKSTPGDVDVGQTATFDITVTSLGPDAAEDVVLTDTLPAVDGGWTLGGPDAGDCSLTGLSLSCAFGTIPADGSRTISLSAATTLEDCGDLVNTALVTARVDTNGTNDEASAQIHVGCADVGVQKTAADESIDVGSTASFTITVTSNGPDTAEDVTLADALPALDGGWSITDGADDCSLAGDALSCAFGDMAAGATESVTLEGATTLDDCGALPNLATVSARLDTNSTNDQDDASIYVTCADVGVQKSATSTVVDVGQTAEFSIVVTSFGPDAAEGVTLSDTLPALAGGWTLGGPDAGDCSLTGLSLSCAFGTLADGATRTLTLSGATSLDDCGLHENTATVGARLDTNATNDADDASIYVTCADVSVEKTPADAAIDVGENATFTITVTSNGPDDATGVTLADALPGGIGWEFVPGGDEGDCSIASGSLSCAFGTIPAGGTRSVTITGATDTGDCDGVRNEVSVSAALDTDPQNNDATAFIDVTCADVGIRKSANQTTVVKGTNFTWTLTIDSLGPDAATGISVTDVVPGGSVLALGGTAASYCGETAGTVTCSIPSLAAGSSLELTIETSTGSLECGIVRNTARIGAAVDTNGTNNEANATIEVSCPFATRTQGFWSTHTAYTERVFDEVFGGTMTVGSGGHVRTIDTEGKLFGAWYSSISQKTTGQKRSSVDQARMVLLQQLVTAKLNCQAFGCSAATASLIADADVAYASSSKALMASLAAQLDAYNNGGDDVPLPGTYGSWNPATPDLSKAIANRAFWDDP